MEAMKILGLNKKKCQCLCLMSYFLFSMILFYSLEDSDSNALILPQKKRNKKKGVDKVNSANWTIFFFSFAFFFFWSRFHNSYVQECERIKMDKNPKLSKAQKRKLKKLEVLAHVNQFVVYSFCVLDRNP